MEIHRLCRIVDWDPLEAAPESSSKGSIFDPRVVATWSKPSDGVLLKSRWSEREPASFLERSQKVQQWLRDPNVRLSQFGTGSYSSHSPPLLGSNTDASTLHRCSQRSRFRGKATATGSTACSSPVAASCSPVASAPGPSASACPQRTASEASFPAEDGQSGVQERCFETAIDRETDPGIGGTGWAFSGCEKPLLVPLCSSETMDGDDPSGPVASAKTCTKASLIFNIASPNETANSDCHYDHYAQWDLFTNTPSMGKPLNDLANAFPRYISHP